MGDLIDKRSQYLSNTHDLNNYNEILNVNQQLEFNYLSDVDRLQETNDVLKSRILKLKQEYLLNDNGIDKYKSLLNFIYISFVFFAIGVILFVSFTKKTVPEKTFYILIIFITLLYLVYILFYILSGLLRRKMAYNQFYWKNIKSTA